MPKSITIKNILSSPVSNPFVYGKAVKNEDFCPRPVEQKILIQSVQTGQNIALLGERRVGKTSLLKQVVARSKSHQELYIDLLQVKSIEDLVKRFFYSINLLDKGLLDKTIQFFSGFKPVLSFDPSTGKANLSFSPGHKIQPENLSSIFKLIQEIHTKKKLVVILDEFQDILHLESHLQCLAILRSEIQFLKNIPFWYSGSVRDSIHNIFVSPDSPFYKSAQMVEIGPLPQKLFTEFLQEKFRSGNRTVTTEILDEIIQTTRSIPGDAQEFCSALWEVSRPHTILDHSHLLAALDCIYSREIKEYESYLTPLTDMQSRALNALAHEGGTAIQSKDFLQKAAISLPASSKKAVERLVHLRIIYQHNKEYKFINPFFRKWLLSRGF